ncbi:hypothetical protein ACGC1H_003091 [Rhizoctonia solani]|uniref:Uncharacterized protein n=1 Tax=Rhizoctonia solani TaxID=456999 RepID=A0A8H3B6R9_9AGAM|nr:unnamed protein product [Rhizoctonia solani]
MILSKPAAISHFTMLSRTLLARRLINTSSRLRASAPALEKGGDEAGASKFASSGKAYVVSEALESERPYGVPSGVYSSGEPMPANPSKESNSSSHSSASTSAPHPKLTKDAATGNLADRNAWPSEEQGKMGLDEAWKHRK